MKKITLFCALLSALVLTGCAGDKVKPDQTLPEIYDSAYNKIDDKNYAEAANEFQNAEKSFPASEWAPDALTMAAYASYIDNDFSGALAITDRFMRFHPGHKNAPYILYLRGMCYYRQVSDVRREPGMSVYALQAFQTLVQRFPDSEYAKNSENKIMILKNYIAGKTLYSARRDMQKQNWTSAIERLQSIITDASDTQMTAEALYRLTEAYTAIGLPEQSKGYASMLRKNFPENEWANKLK